MLSNKLTQAAAGSAASDPLYADDVFSTTVYRSTDSSLQITNGLDLGGKGGLTWHKIRTNYSGSHYLFDSERPFNRPLRTNDTGGEVQNTDAGITSYNSDGYTISADSADDINNSFVENFVSWSFRKAEGFFDVVTYTGDGTNNRAISHNLGSVPGCIIIKRTGASSNWYVYHRSIGANYMLRLDTDTAQQDGSATFPSVPTSTTFTVSSNINSDQSGNTYVAYIFAHDAQSFGADADESIIKCGYYTGNNSARDINLGFEPQWILLKVFQNSTGNWYIYDHIRGWSVQDDENQNHLLANSNSEEFSTGQSNGLKVSPTGSGFRLHDSDHNNNGVGYIYMAIRRPHKPVEDATKFFETLTYNGTSSARIVSTTVNADAIIASRRGGGDHFVFDRVRGSDQYVRLNTGAGENPQTTAITTIGNNFLEMGGGSTVNDSGGGGMLLHLLRRIPNAFEIATWTGTGTAGLTVDHKLGVVPEMMWVKKRTETSGGDHFQIYHSAVGNTKYAMFKTDPFYTSGARWNNTTPTATQFTLGDDDDVNTNTHQYFAYLFATLDGVTKVGSYSGTGSAQNVDCGFSSGARFVMIKRTDTETQGSHPDRTDFYVWDSTRGIISGDDPWITYSSSAAEVTNTDYIDPLNSGFTVSSTGGGLNTSGGTYLFFAIA